MFGPGAKFPPLAPLAPLAPRALAPLVPLAPAYAALPVLATPGAWQAKSHGPPVKMPAAAAKPQEPGQQSVGASEGQAIHGPFRRMPCHMAMSAIARLAKQHGNYVQEQNKVRHCKSLMFSFDSSCVF